MQFRFKKHPYQLAAVNAVASVFNGQMKADAISQPPLATGKLHLPAHGVAASSHALFANAPLTVPDPEVLRNLQTVQRAQGIPPSTSLSATAVAPINLDVEMETGTGKTYCYIRTMFELFHQYGWSKYVVAVPSVAIREGVYRAFNETAEHFQEEYGSRARCIVYDSRRLETLQMFDTDASICVMVINAQAFNTTSRDSRRIYEELDAFQSRRPIDVISAARPIVIIDEPQKMEGAATLNGLAAFKPLFALRYSATHKTMHSCVYRLDALAAYRQKLVKKISVRGITIRGLPGTNPYFYLSQIVTSRRAAPSALCDIEVRTAAGIKRATRRLAVGDNLYALSRRLEQYRRFVVSTIDAHAGAITFTNGTALHVGDVIGDVAEDSVRRLQIQEAIACHLEKEAKLFALGIKVLTLFFIDTVAKYRQYTDKGETSGEYAQIFEEEYSAAVGRLHETCDPAYQAYLQAIAANQTHRGYFAIDKRTRRLTDPTVARRGETAGETNDVSAYELILQNKAQLLSLKEPVRFLFSHSALREGWDNPNVFVICTLKHSDNTVSRRQEVGRGLRLCVTQSGERIDDPQIAHDINRLTVVANESYKAFVSGLQSDMRQTLRGRTQAATVAFFEGRSLVADHSALHITAQLARQIYRYLLQNSYVDDDDLISDSYMQCRQSDSVAELPSALLAHKEPLLALIDTLHRAVQLPDIANDRGRTPNQLTPNFGKKQFKDLWAKINHCATYRVAFAQEELVRNCVDRLNGELRVTKLDLEVQAGDLRTDITQEMLREGSAFQAGEHRRATATRCVAATVKLDLIGRLADTTKLTRHTLAEILKGLTEITFAQYRANPEDFISKAEQIILDQQATLLVEHVAYDPTRRRHSSEIFTAPIQEVDASSLPRRHRHIYEYVVTASDTEKQFVDKLDSSSDVVVYAKLPRSFYIPTPVGKYNPDWAIAFKKGRVKHVFFVAETKGTLSSLQLRRIEKCKIECARKFFAAACASDVRYDVVDSYDRLLDLVS